MVRRKVTLRIDSEVIQKAKDAGMNLSYFLEVKLVEYLAMLQAPRERFELSLPRRGTGSQVQQRIKRSTVKKYLRLRSINGISKNWKRDITNIITRYLDYVDWTIDEYKTIRYLNKIQKQY